VNILPLTLGLSIVVASCAAGTSQPARPVYPVHCFQEILDDGSVISLEYIEYVDVVVGILDYAFAEKDNAYGAFSGTLTGRVIAAKWSFSIEGARQDQWILIKVDGDRAYRAYGELVAVDGVLKFDDLDKLTWSDEMHRVRCN
jgi:hypothetical protein